MTQNTPLERITKQQSKAITIINEQWELLPQELQQRLIAQFVMQLTLHQQ